MIVSSAIVKMATKLTLLIQQVSHWELYFHEYSDLHNILLYLLLQLALTSMSVIHLKEIHIHAISSVLMYLVRSHVVVGVAS